MIPFCFWSSSDPPSRRDSAPACASASYTGEERGGEGRGGEGRGGEGRGGEGRGGEGRGGVKKKRRAKTRTVPQK